MALHRHRSVSLRKGGVLSGRSGDPETVARFKRALKKAQDEGKAAISAAQGTERDRFGLRQGVPSTSFDLLTTRDKKARKAGVLRINKVRSEHVKKVAKLQDLLDRVQKNENTIPSNPPNNPQFRNSAANQRLLNTPSGQQNLFLGGFIKKIGSIAKTALPIAAGLAGTALLPGIGGLIAGGLASKLVGGGGGQEKKGAGDVATTSSDALDEVGDIVEPAKATTTGNASFGAAFRQGGALPTQSNSLRDFAAGGRGKAIGGNAIEFTGPDHEGGGIDLPGVDAEVEGGETLDLVVNKNGKANSRGVPFVFSKALKVPGSNVSFANAHKAAVRRGASPDDISGLAERQEQLAGVLRGPNSQKELFLGGLISTAGKFLSSSGLGSKVLGAAGKVLPFLPGIANTFQGLTGNVESASTDPIDRSSLGVLQSERDRVARTNEEVRFNPNAVINENRRALGSIFADRNASDAAKAAAVAGTQVNNANIRTDFRNREIDANVRIRADKRRNLLSLTQNISQQEAGFNQFDARSGFQNEQERLAAEGAKTNLLNTGLNQIGNIFAQRQQDKFNAAADEKNIGLLTTGRRIPVLDTFFGRQAQPKKKSNVTTSGLLNATRVGFRG